jgi:phosphatidylinositol alpha-1,6-mannosyltransferase
METNSKGSPLPGSRPSLIVSTQNFPPAIGGIENLMYSLCQALSGAGVGLTVFADRPRGGATQDFDNRQIYRVLRYGGMRPWRRRRKARAINQHGRQATGLNLITDSWKSLEYLDPGPYRCVICLAHGTEIPVHPTWWKDRRIRASFRRATYIVANSTFTAGLTRPYVAAAGRIRVIHPGIESPARDPELEQSIRRHFADRGPILITVARLEPRKGHSQVLDILPELIRRYPRLLYLIVGEGTMAGQLRRQVQDSCLGEHVQFPGTLDRVHKSAYLAISDLFVMPGTRQGQDVEGFGLAYIEAGSHGVPSVASDCGGAREAVTHGETGLVGETDNLAQLRDNILLLLGDVDLRHLYGERARARAREFYWDRKLEEYLSLLYPPATG